MVRRMADSIRATSCPPGFDLYLGYVNGNRDWRSYEPLTKLYPHAIVVPCSVTASNVGTVLDVEQGDATPIQAPVWARMRRAAGVHPTVYCNEATWPAVRQAFARAGEPEPEWLIAGYSTPPDSTIPAGAVGHQWIDHGAYDESTVADYWPGVDPEPIPKGPPPMARFPNAVDACWAPNGGVWVLGSDGGVGAYHDAPLPPAPWSYPGLPPAQRVEPADGPRRFLRITPSTIPGKSYDLLADDGSVYSF